MDVFVRTFGPGRHTYRPFPKDARFTSVRLPTLQDLCRNRIVGLVTLSRIKAWSALPSYLRRHLTTLSTQDFVEVECAPFKDNFGSYICHKSLSYRVRCLQDNVEYMAVHVAAKDFSETSWRWINLTHTNLMCVHALAVDPATTNVYLIMDVPDASLESLQSFLLSKGLCFPEYFLWRVARQLASVIMHAEQNGLSFFTFDLKDVYLARGTLKLDNGLTGKSWFDAVPPSRSKLSASWLYYRGKIQQEYSSIMFTRHLGLVLTKLASIALVDLKKQKVTEDGDFCMLLDGVPPVVPEGATTYSSDFFDMLVSLHSTKPDPLSVVCHKAKSMMRAIKTKLALKCRKQLRRTKACTKLNSL